MLSSSTGLPEGYTLGVLESRPCGKDVSRNQQTCVHLANVSTSKKDETRLLIHEKLLAYVRKML